MASLDLVHASSGNVSVRVGGWLLITPSGVAYRWLSAEQIIAMDIADGRVGSGSGLPSSEWRMHAAIYRARPDVRAVVHTHSPWATRCAVHGLLVTASDEASIVFGASVPKSEHAPPGGWELADAVVGALGDAGRAVLVARHGAVTVGRNLTEALHLAEMLEHAAMVSLYPFGRCSA